MIFINHECHKQLQLVKTSLSADYWFYRQCYLLKPTLVENMFLPRPEVGFICLLEGQIQSYISPTDEFGLAQFFIFQLENIIPSLAIIKSKLIRFEQQGRWGSNTASGGRNIWFTVNFLARTMGLLSTENSQYAYSNEIGHRFQK